MAKLDIAKDLAKRKYKTTNRFLYWIYYFVMSIVGKKYNGHFERIDDVSKYKGPCFVIFNHLSRLDHYYVMKITYPRRVNILAGYCEFYRSHLHWAFKMNNILPKKQYTNDFLGTKAILSIINKGGCVAFAPEGLASNDGMNKPIVPNTGSLFKHCKVPVYFVELRGQYLQNTKVCLDERYGQTYAKISKLFTPEDLENLSVEEIDAKINLAFKQDEYAWQKEKHIKWDTKGRVCHRLEDILFECPKCHSRFEMVGHDNVIECKKCGNGATMDDYYDFHKFNDDCVIPDLVSTWVNQERINIIKEIRQNNDFSYSEKVQIGRLPNDHYVKDLKTSEIVSEGLLTIDHEGMRFRGSDTDKYDFDLNYKALWTTIHEVDSSYFNIYIKNEYHDIFPLERHSAYFMTVLIEEMHRLHVNTYKNFPWNDYMYEGLEEK